MDAIASVLTDFWDFVFPYVIPSGVGSDRPFGYFGVGSVINVARDYLSFLAIGLVIFALLARKRGERFSLWSGTSTCCRWRSTVRRR